MPLTRRQQLLAKVEATYATDPVHAAIDALLVHDFNLTYNQTQSGRAQFTPSLSAVRSARLGKRFWNASFWTQLRGNSAALGTPTPVPLNDPLMRACGMSATFDAMGPPANNWTYQPESAGFESVALDVEFEGSYVQMLGCRGNTRLELVAGEVAKQHFDFSGLWQTPTNDAARPITPTLTDDVDPPVVVATGFVPNFGSGAENPTAAQWGHIRSAMIDLRNQIVPSESLTVGDGIRSFEMVGRGSTDDPGASISLEVEYPASIGAAVAGDYWTKLDGRTNTTATATFTLGSVAGNTVEIIVPRFSVDDVQFTDFDGRVGLTVEGRLLVSSSAATSDDELQIRHS